MNAGRVSITHGSLSERAIALPTKSNKAESGHALCPICRQGQRSRHQHRGGATTPRDDNLIGRSGPNGPRSREERRAVTQSACPHLQPERARAAAAGVVPPAIFSSHSVCEKLKMLDYLCRAESGPVSP